MKARAALLYKQGFSFPFTESKPFEVETIDVEGPGEGEVLVEVKAAGLCHTDLSTAMGLGERQFPYVGGHEGAGIVRDVGPGISHLKSGDHVVMSVAPGCGHCCQCKDERQVLCDSVELARARGTLANGRRRLSKSGKPVFHYSGISSFCEFAVCIASSLIKIDEQVPLDIAAVFGCAVVTGAGAVLNSAKVRASQNVAVIGLGGIGMNAVMAARIAGAETIIGIDINERKFSLAKELGCTHTYTPKNIQITQSILDMTSGGLDFVFEASGSPESVRFAGEITKRGGEIICIGLGSPINRYEYNHNSLVSGEKVLRGSVVGSGNAQRDIRKYIELYKAGKMPVDRLKSLSLPLGDLNVALDKLHNGGVLRQIILPGN